MEIRNMEKMTNNKIDSGSYGVCLFSLDVFSTFLKKNKIRSKSLIDFFRKNKSLSDQSLCSGVILPLNTMWFNQYYFDVFIARPSTFFLVDEWNPIASKETFHLEVTGDELWICSIDVLNSWQISKFDSDVVGYPVKSGPQGVQSFYYEAQRVSVPSGKYHVNVIGYQRKHLLHTEDEDYGIGFSLTAVDHFEANNRIPNDINFCIVR